MTTELLREIDEFMAEYRIGEHRFGILAINNGRLVERLRKGGRIWPETEERVRTFMEDERARRANPQPAEAAAE